MTAITDHTVTVQKQTYKVVPIGTVTPHPRNTRKGNLPAIGESIEQHGFYGAVIAQKSTGHILAGNHRWIALRDAGATHIPVIWVDVDDDRASRILLVDNRSNDLAGYDDQALAEVLQELATTDSGLAGTGYVPGDVYQPLTDDQHDTDPPSDPVTKSGDIWHLGPHRLWCGDARTPWPAELLNGERINLAFTSPPYAQCRTYDPSSGFEPPKPDDYTAWFAPVAATIAEHLAPGGSYCLNIKEHSEDGQRSLYVKDLVLAHAREWGWRYVDEFCWVKANNGVPGVWPNRCKNAWEPVFHFSRDKQITFDPLANATESERTFSYSPSHQGKADSGLLRGGTTTEKYGFARPSNVLMIHSESGVGGHAAPFPAELPGWFIRAFTDPGGHILDPFGGSGTTFLAADRLDRVGHLIEISPGYCDLICTRYQQSIGTPPQRAGIAHDFTTV